MNPTQTPEERKKRYEDRIAKGTASISTELKTNIESVEWLKEAQDAKIVAACHDALAANPHTGGDFAAAWQTISPEQKALIIVWVCHPTLGAWTRLPKMAQCAAEIMPFLTTQVKEAARLVIPSSVLAAFDTGICLAAKGSG